MKEIMLQWQQEKINLNNKLYLLSDIYIYNF